MIFYILALITQVWRFLTLIFQDFYLYEKNLSKFDEQIVRYCRYSTFFINKNVFKPKNCINFDKIMSDRLKSWTESKCNPKKIQAMADSLLRYGSISNKKIKILVISDHAIHLLNISSIKKSNLKHTPINPKLTTSQFFHEKKLQ